MSESVSGYKLLLDVLFARAPFADDAAKIWSAVETKKAVGLASAVSFTTVYYVVRRAQSRQRANEAVQLVREVFSIVACDNSIIRQAIDSDFNDFEDAVQYFSARAADVDVILTRNVDHFPASEVSIMSPSAFLAAYTFQ